MFVPWKALHSHHPVMEICAKGTERKRRWRVEEDTHAGFVTVFQSYGRPIAMVSLFKYPGRVLTASEDDWNTVVSNLSKAWRKWARMSRILGQEVSDAWKSGIFYKSVIQSTLLFG